MDVTASSPHNDAAALLVVLVNAHAQHIVAGRDVCTARASGSGFASPGRA